MRLRVTVISPGGGGGGAGHTGGGPPYARSPGGGGPGYVAEPSFDRAPGGGGGGAGGACPGAGSGSKPGMAAGGGGAAADGAGAGLYQDFCCTLTQMRVLAKAALDTNRVAATAANQRIFITGLLCVCEPGFAACMPGSRRHAAIARGAGFRCETTRARWKP